LLILDEVQVGMGRTGKLFAHEHYGIEPDIMTLAKAIGNGFPIGVTLAKGYVASAFTPGTHASTFGGNPLAMAAGIATLETMEKEGVLANCRKMGDYLMMKLKALQRNFAFIREVRGKGLICGVELDREGAGIVSACLEKGLLINCTGANVLRFVPPLTIQEADVDQAVSILKAAMEEQR
ncbi:MAG: aminotransferase class III-fold pyridoxal phosphate-dependent enzyme, partial [Smithellaceae bacterium]|nr:aminotransferase class III-fold pyridoxal phosphate-dependent enzyme [Smithellaceae bacterium]